MDLNAILSDKPTPARTEVAAPDASSTKIEVDEPLGSGPDDADAEQTDASAPAEKAAEKPAEPPAKEAAADTDAARDEKGRFQKTVPQEALHAERQRRQAIEAELAKMREAKPLPSVLDDEDGAFKARIAQATQPLHERLFKLSVKSARNVTGREDYDDVLGTFLESADKDPRLMEAFRAADDPGEYAYSVGKQIKELSDVGGDIIAYGKKKQSEGAAEAEALKTQIKAMQAEIETLKASKDKQSKVPQSLNSEASAAGREQTFAGPKPLKSILNS